MMLTKMAAVRSVETSEITLKGTVAPPSSAVGAFSALLQTEDSDGGRPGVNLDTTSGQRASGTVRGSKRSQTAKTETSASAANSPRSAASFPAQPVVQSTLPTSRTNRWVGTLSAAADRIAPDPQQMRFVDDTAQRQKSGAIEGRVSERAFGNIQDAVPACGAENHSGADENLADADPAPASRRPPVPAAVVSAKDAIANRNLDVSASTGSEAVSMPLTLAGSMAASAQIDLTSTFIANDESHVPDPSGESTKQSVPGLEANLPANLVEQSAVSGSVLPAQLPPAQPAQNPGANIDLTAGNIAQSGPQSFRGSPGSPSQHHESSSQSSSSGSAIESQHAVDRPVSEVPSFATATQTHGSGAVAQPGHHDSQSGAVPSRQFTMQHLAEMNQAKALQNSMRDIRVGIQTESFGRVTVQAVTESGQLSAQVLLENGKQGAVLAAHLPALEAKLTQQYGMSASVSVGSGLHGGLGGDGGNRQADSSPSSQRNQTPAGQTRSPVMPAGELAGVVPAVHSRYVTSVLDVTV